MYTLDQKLGASVLRTSPIEFCLTVPAIWSEVAKEKTLKACQKAGLKSDSEILLVSEPVSSLCGPEKDNKLICLFRKLPQSMLYKVLIRTT
jgi:hypothetical protein